MKHIVIAVAMTILAVGCTTYKTYTRPEDISAENLFGKDIISPDTINMASIPWREFFHDSRLQALIDTGLANNADLRIASLRVTQAEATLSAARMAYLPAVAFNPQGSISSYVEKKQLRPIRSGCRPTGKSILPAVSQPRNEGLSPICNSNTAIGRQCRHSLLPQLPILISIYCRLMNSYPYQRSRLRHGMR